MAAQRGKIMAISETRILIALPKELKNQLDEEAKKRRITRSGLIRLAITQWLNQESLKENLEREVSKRR